jgi:hypothetical protein
MSESTWNPWKVTAIGMALVMVTALISGLVVANWTGPLERPEPTPPATTASASRPSERVASAIASRSSATAHVTANPAVPTQVAIDSCNRQAASTVSEKNKTVEIVKDAGVGALIGAAVGAAGGAIADGGKGAGKGAAIGGVVGAGGGALYGLNETKKHDEAYRAAYANCMRARGYAG